MSHDGSDDVRSGDSNIAMMIALLIAFVRLDPGKIDQTFTVTHAVECCDQHMAKIDRAVQLTRQNRTESGAH